MEYRWAGSRVCTFRAEDADANYRVNRLFPTIYASFEASASNRVATSLHPVRYRGETKLADANFRGNWLRPNSRPFRSLCPLSVLYII